MIDVDRPGETVDATLTGRNGAAAPQAAEPPGTSALAGASKAIGSPNSLPSFTDASDRTQMNLAHKAALIVDAFPDRIPKAAELEDMTRAFGVELVAVALTKILATVNPNRAFLERVDRRYRDIQLKAGREARAHATSSAASGAVATAKIASSLDGWVGSLDQRAELCVIESVDPMNPGLDWGGHVESWRAWGRKAGLTTDVIQTDKKNSLLANAEIIRRELALQKHDRRIIATVGQGSAEFRLLVEQLLKNESKNARNELSGIQMWVNVSGMIRGASGVNRKRASWWDRKMMSLTHALSGRSPSIGHQLSHTNPRLRIEPELRGLPFVCVSMVGFPTMGDVPGPLKMSFIEMSRISPNDGLAFFHEAIVQPGYIVPVPGMSHRTEPEKLGPWFQAVLSAFTFDRDIAPTEAASPVDQPAGRARTDRASWKNAPLAIEMPDDFDDGPALALENEVDFK